MRAATRRASDSCRNRGGSAFNGEAIYIYIGAIRVPIEFLKRINNAQEVEAVEERTLQDVMKIIYRNI